jgi:hypothetical protein
MTMSDNSNLTDLTIAAHGGLDRWNGYTCVTAALRNGGLLWALKGQDGVLASPRVRVDLHRQFASHFPINGPGRRTALTPKHVAIETDSGEVLAERDNPRDSFVGHVLQTPWDELQLAYFAGYAMWTYLTAPFSFTMPGFKTEELTHWEEDGQTWRRLKVTFPDDIATHSTEQIFYIGDDGLIKRYDYNAEVLAAGWSVHYPSEYREVGGIMVPTKRRVYPRNDDGTPNLDLLFVSIDLDGITFR